MLEVENSPLLFLIFSLKNTTVENFVKYFKRSAIKTEEIGDNKRYK
jgi:hypothetical protein